MQGQQGGYNMNNFNNQMGPPPPAMHMNGGNMMPPMNQGPNMHMNGGNMNMGGFPQGGNNMYANPNQMQQNQPKFGFRPMLESFHNGIFIKQKFEAFEAITGCETANKYYVYERGTDNKKMGRKIIKCKEESTFLSRQCLKGSARPIQMNCFNLFDNDNLCLQLIKPYKIPILCWNRPMMSVNYTEDGNFVNLGKVVDNYDFCNYSFDVLNANGEKRFHIEAACNQLGFHCQCPCDACERIIFNIWKGDKSEECEPLVKTGKGCGKNMMGDADNFSIPFPPGATFEDKALLLATGLFIDYMMFEENGKGNQSN